jgi:hypothetical protein
VIKSINFPWGAGGNHIRWLLFLDKQMVAPWNNGPQDIPSKLNFIKNKIYPVTRTWNNWMQFEWNYRNDLNQQIQVKHDIFNGENSDEKVLYLTFNDINIPFNHYFHINLGLNCLTPAQFKTQLNVWIDKFNFIKNKINEFDNKKFISIDVMYNNQELDYDFYKEIVDFFGFDDLYGSAKIVHDWYRQRKIQSAQEFYNYFVGDEFQEYLNVMHMFGSQIK